MKKYTYIVFEDSGGELSHIIKRKNPNTKIIHFCYDNQKKNSVADTIISLDTNDGVLTPSSYYYFEYLKEKKTINKQIDNIIKDNKNIIVIDSIGDLIYPLELHITKKAIKNNNNCINIFCEPFEFFGKKVMKHYKDYFNEITKIKNNNYYFSGDEFRSKLPKVYSVIELFRMTNEISYNISVNLNENIDLIVDKTISKYQDKVYKYVQVSYDDDITGNCYSYKTTIDNIEIGDTVLVDRNGYECEGTVEAINYYTKETAPYPVDLTKDIIEVINYDYIDEDDEDIKYCPICNTKLINIVYGMPSHDMLLKAQEGEIRLGGCMISKDDPKYYCKACNKEFHEYLVDREEIDKLIDTVFIKLRKYEKSDEDLIAMQNMILDSCNKYYVVRKLDDYLDNNKTSKSRNDLYVEIFKLINK